MFRNTSVASFAVFASQGLAIHTWNAEVVFIKFPKAQKIVDDSFLLREAAEFGHKAGLVEHGAAIEIPTQSISKHKPNVRVWHLIPGPYFELDGIPP